MDQEAHAGHHGSMVSERPSSTELKPMLKSLTDIQVTAAR